MKPTLAGKSEVLHIADWDLGTRWRWDATGLAIVYSNNMPPQEGTSEELIREKIRANRAKGW